MSRHRVIGAAVAGLATVAFSATAAAKPLDRGTFHDEFAGEVEDFCDAGLTVQFEGVVDGRFRVATHGGDLIYFAEHLDVTRTLTNVDNGAFITTHDRVLNKDLHVSDNGDGTLTVVVLATGNATVLDADGRAIGRNPGQLRIELLIDHGGTPDFPDDDVIISETVTKGSTGRSDDFCEVAVAALT